MNLRIAIGMVSGVIGVCIALLGYLNAESSQAAYDFWGMFFLFVGIVIVFSNTVLKPMSKAGILPPRRSFWEVFSSLFDKEFDSRTSHSMHRINHASAMNNPVETLDVLFLGIWKDLLDGMIFESAFREASRVTGKAPNRKQFEIEAKAYYYEKALESFHFAHPILGAKHTEYFDRDDQESDR